MNTLADLLRLCRELTMLAVLWACCAWPVLAAMRWLYKRDVGGPRP